MRYTSLSFAKGLFNEKGLVSMKFTNTIKTPFEYIKSLFKWLFISLIVGSIGGVIGSLFHISVDYVTALREENFWLIFLLPAGAILISFLYKLSLKAGDLDTDRVIKATNTDTTVPFIMAPLIFLSTVITHLVGGSSGREGAALQLGGSIGFSLGKIFNLDKGDRHIIVMAGMSALFSALFGTPSAAVFFSLEVANVGVMAYPALFPCAVSSLISSKVSTLFGIVPIRFLNIKMPEAISLELMAKVIVLAIFLALVSILFCFIIKKCDRISRNLIKNNYIRAFVGGIILILLTLILGTDYNGAGFDVITLAMQGDARYEAFMLKILFTAITIAAGFKGGEIVPAFFVGSTFGCVIANFLGLDPSFGAALGFVSLFCGIVNCPVASFVLALEVFGGKAMPFFFIVCATSYMMSGYGGLYKSQSFVSSKLKDEYVNLTTKDEI